MEFSICDNKGQFSKIQSHLRVELGDMMFIAVEVYSLLPQQCYQEVIAL